MDQLMLVKFTREDGRPGRGLGYDLSEQMEEWPERYAPPANLTCTPASEAPELGFFSLDDPKPKLKYSIQEFFMKKLRMK